MPYRAQPSIGIGVFGGSGRVSTGVGVGIPVGSPDPISRCERTMVFHDNRVVEQTWIGSPDYCYAFRRD